MSNAAVPVSVRILEKEYQFSCEPQERADLVRAAEILNQRMRTARDAGKVVGLDRIAIMVSMNLINEMIKLRETDDHVDDTLVTKVQGLSQRVESALQNGQQLDL